MSAPGGKAALYPNGTSGKEDLKLKSNGKPHKLPVNPHQGGPARTNDASTWATFEVAKAAASRWNVAGVGFVFTAPDPFAGVDLDDCRDRASGQLADWALEIISALDSYTEVSPSETGVKIWIRAKLPPGGRQRSYDTGAVEMWEQGRYFTFTGLHLKGTPREIHDAQKAIEILHTRLFETQRRELHATAVDSCLSDDEVLSKARAARNGARFDALWRGEHAFKSPSEADAALCARLAFWTRDPKQIDRLFRGSGLMRDKWDLPGYAKRTVELALHSVRESYRPRVAR